MKRDPKKQLNLLTAIIILDLLSGTMTVPLFPIIVADPAYTILGPDATSLMMKVHLGLLFGTFALAQFIGSPYFGGLSDKYGRKKILTFIFVLNIVQYIVIAISIYTQNFLMLIIARSFAGFAGGTVFIEQSAIADLSGPEDKAKNLGRVGIAFGVGLILGPILGTLLSNPEIHPSFSLATPFLAILVINSLNLFLLIRYFEEPLRTFNPSKFSLFSGIRNLYLAFSQARWRALFTAALFMNCALFFFIQFFQVILIDRFGYSITQQGLTLAYCGLIMALSQGVMLPVLTHKYSVKNLVIVCLPLMAVGFVLLTISYTPLALFVSLTLLIAAQGVCTPGILAMISNKAGAEQQGATIGIHQSVQSFASAAPPLLAAPLVAAYLDFPLVFGAVTSLIAFAVFYLFEFRNRSAAAIPR